eukprot:GHVS01063355.1.p1 GENE.GHVS01063355.1~~GHVS01063355.1.p1  ORF type:complete len:321 (+),score=63.57 GHVS01063355.1:87-1049(+)
MSFSCVDPSDARLSWLFIGNKEAARNLRCLKSLRIRYVVNATPTATNGGLPNYFERDPFFSYCRIPIQDNASENLKPHFETIWEFLETARVREDGNVLVHCNLGVSRSVSLVCSYAIRHLPQMTFTEILQTIQANRPIAKPNDSFMQQLQQLDANLQKTCTTTITTCSSSSSSCSSSLSSLPSSPLLPSSSPPSCHSYPTTSTKRKCNNLSSSSSLSKHVRMGPSRPPLLPSTPIGPVLPPTMRKPVVQQQPVIGPPMGPVPPPPSHMSQQVAALPDPPPPPSAIPLVAVPPPPTASDKGGGGPQRHQGDLRGAAIVSSL